MQYKSTRSQLNSGVVVWSGRKNYSQQARRFAMTFAELLDFLKEVEQYKPHLLEHAVELAVDLDYTVQLDLVEAMSRGQLMFTALYIDSK